LRPLRLAVAGFLIMALTSGAEALSPRPYTVRVDQGADGQVVFRFFDAPEYHGGQLVAIGTNYVTVYRKGQHFPPLWHILLEYGALVGEVKYGVLPWGFRQHTPSAGQPPALEDGVEYCVTSHGGTCFKYRYRSP